jgi:iron complex outermembrane recepter protein
MLKKSDLYRAMLLAIGSGLAATVVPVYAQGSQLGTVTVTGSALNRGIDSQSSLPVTVISIEELKSTGVTSVEEIVRGITASQSSTTSTRSVGSGTGGASYVDLRGLGASRTLILLNGRRLAFFGFGSGAVDVSSIPFAALERVEVLRDGASALYGADAVGGVVNFITKRNYKGLELSVDMLSPKGSAGSKQGLSVSGGLGDLESNGYNVWFAYDTRTQKTLPGLQRDFAKTGVLPGQSVAGGTSGTTFPANFNYRDTTGAIRSGNITNASGCAPPLSLRVGTLCRYDFTAAVDIIPETENSNFMLRGGLKLPGSHLLSAEYVATTSTNMARVAPDPVTGLTMPTTSPFYPKSFAGIDPTRDLFGIGWRMEPGGQRENTSEATANRFVLELTGETMGWDYRAGLFNTQSKVQDGPTNGYVSKARIQAGINAGVLNPFGAQSAQAVDLINAAKASGIFAVGKGTATGIDIRGSRNMFNMAGGPAQISVGAEMRTETYKQDTDDALVSSVPSAGRSPYHATGDRKVYAVSAEALFPVTKQLELTAQARIDRYSDFGSKFNPKVGARYEVSKDLLFRGSANTGFKAPNLDDLYGPQSGTFTSDAYDDPVLCPRGTVAAGGIASRDCGQQYQALQGGNPALKAETSRQFSFGSAFRPMSNLSLTVDYWNVQLKETVAAYPEQTAVSQPARLFRCNSLSAAEQGRWERCNVVSGSNAVAYLLTLTDNLGATKADGFDFSAAWNSRIDGIGRLGVTYDSTYMRSYQYQSEPGGEFKQNVGRYSDSSPVFRWQHVVGATLAMGNWKPAIAIRHKTGYSDQSPNSDGSEAVVGSYTLVDAGVTYSGIKNLSLNLSVRNLFDTNPPFSNQNTTFQRGYDPRYTDPLGRAVFVRAGYKF